MAARIGADMRAVGVHQGLAPVLDVVRDARWGRVEETIGEDPYLVGTIATAYVRGLESAGSRRDPQALRRLLGLEGRPQPRPGLDRPARARRRAAAAVRDGGARVRGALGHELRTPTSTACPSAADALAAHRAAARHLGLRRHRRRRLLRDRLPAPAARGRRGLGGCRRVGARRRHRRRAADRQDLLGPARRGRRGRTRRRGARRPGAAPRAAAEGRARPARRRLVARARCARGAATWARLPTTLRGSVDLDSAENRDSPARSPSRRVVLLRNDGLLPLPAAPQPRDHRRDRPERRRPLRRARLLLVPGTRGRAASRGADRHRAADPARRAPRRVPGRRPSCYVRGTIGRRRRDRRHPRGRRRGRRGRCRRARARRPGRPVRPRHERRGLRRRDPRAARRPAGAARRRAGRRARRPSSRCSPAAPTRSARP